MALQTRRVTTTTPSQDGTSISTSLTDEVADLAQDSIEFSVNAKGEPSYSVKVYGKGAEELSLRLIAAAPDLLAALADLVESLERPGGGGGGLDIVLELVAAKAALAKAKGASQ